MLFSAQLMGEIQVVASRSEVGGVWNNFTGDRNLYQARLDSTRGVVILEKFATNTQLNPRTLVWQREYPLHTPEELARATEEMRKIELSWPLETYYRLHARDCLALIFSIPVGNLFNLADQTRQIVSRLEAPSEDFNIKRLVKFTPACGSPPFYLGAVLTHDHKIKRFAIVSETGAPLPLRVERENGQLLIKNQTTTLVRISGQNSFDSESGGEFTASLITDCARGLYKTYDFEIRRRRHNGNFVWSLLFFQELDGRISLSNDRDPEFDVGQAIAQAPVDLVTGVLDGIFGTLIWNIFVSGSTKRQMVENSIYDEAKKNETMSSTFSDQELRALAHRIASNASLPWFAPFSGTDGIKKRAAMEFAFELVKKIALEKLPEGSLPDMANGVAIHATRDLEQCLRAASSSGEIDVCVAKFARSAPYRVGRELLTIHIETGLRGQGLNTQQRRGIVATSLKRFDQCSQSNYFRPYDEHIKQLASRRRSGHTARPAGQRRPVRRGFVDDELPFNANNVIMSCLFQGVMDGVDEATTLGVDEMLRPLMADPAARTAKRESLVRAMRQCLTSAGYFVQTENFRQYNHNHLQSLEVEQFQTKLNECVAATKVKTAEVVIERQVATNSGLITATRDNPAQREQVIQLTLSEGLRPCLAAQRGIPDPAKCTTMAQNVATRESFILILQDNLATEMGRDTSAYNWALREVGLGNVEPRPYSFNLRKCFDDRRAVLLTSLARDGSTIPTDDFSNANCITRAIMELAPEMVRQKYLKTLREKPDLKNIPALRDPALITEMGQKMKQCLFEELKSFDTVDALSAALEGAQARCTVSLYKEILPRVIEMAMNQKLLQVVPDEARRRELVARLKADFSGRIQGLDSEAAIMAQVDAFTADATMEIVKQSLRWSVADNLPGSEARQNTLSDQIIAQVVTPAWETRMRAAIAAGDDALQSKLQAQIKKTAAPLIMESALPERLREHVTSAGTRTTITRGVVQEYRRCLGRIKDDARDFEQKFQQCAVAATNGATRAIFEVSLGSALESYFPVLTGTPAEISGNRAAQRQIKSRLLVSGLWTEIARANAAGPRAVARLGDIFKVRAGREVALVLVERELYRSLTGDIRERVVPRAQANARACFQNIEDKLTRRETVNIQVAMDSCSKKIKVETAAIALMESFENSLGFLSNQPARTGPVLTNARQFFDRCVAGYTGWTEAQMEARLNECMSKTVIYFAQHLAQATLDYMAPIRAGNPVAMPAFRACLDTIEGQVSRVLTWVKDEVEKCTNNVLKPNLKLEIHRFYNTKIPGNLSGGERAVVEDGFTMLTPIFDGKIISTGSAATDPISSMGDTFTQLAGFLGDSARFDQVTTQRRITSFKVHMRSRLSGTSTMTDKQFIEELVRSDLMTTMIEGYIAEKIIAKADELGLGDQARRRVVSPENMQAIFERNATGRDIMDTIKREVVRPLLAGTPMNVVMAKVKSDIMIEVNRRIADIKRAISPF
ncbi:MAG: hypothetical protein A2X86_16490 [Bdellovibrionales bacterium GWA2_49_15]|nr:MAG: hypothetical protein A2X86_16490 [Bdellovibrionales bacterium GWA2_49_15]HAZ13704.1 hypothetical protein [Bdellovibrionales bacterium]